MTNAQRRREIASALLTGALKQLPEFKDPLEGERIRMAIKKMKRKFKGFQPKPAIP